MKKPRVTARWVRNRTRSILDYQGAYKIKADGKEVATVMHARDPFSDNAKRRAGFWIYYGRIVVDGVKIASKNTAVTKEDWDTAEKARDACIAWVKGVLDEHRNRADATPAASDSNRSEAPRDGSPRDPRSGG